MHSREEYINYRIERAEEMYQDALLLSDEKRWKSCINRLYYSCFQLLDALMFSKGMKYKTHSGLKNSFFQNYIKSGAMDKDLGKLYDKLFNWRNEGDYSVFVDFAEEDVKPLIPQVKEFLNTLESLIKKEM